MKNLVFLGQPSLTQWARSGNLANKSISRALTYHRVTLIFVRVDRTLTNISVFLYYGTAKLHLYRQRALTRECRFHESVLRKRRELRNVS